MGPGDPVAMHPPDLFFPKEARNPDFFFFLTKRTSVEMLTANFFLKFKNTCEGWVWPLGHGRDFSLHKMDGRGAGCFVAVPSHSPREVFRAGWVLNNY